MEQKDLVGRITDFLDVELGFTVNQLGEVKNYLKKDGIPKLSDLILAASDKERVFENFMNYVRKYDEFPLLVKYNSNNKNFANGLMQLFRDKVDAKKLAENINPKNDRRIYESRANSIKHAIKSLFNKNNYYKISDNGIQILDKVFKEYQSFGEFEKAVFVIKLAETIGYSNLVKICGLEKDAGINGDGNSEEKSKEFIKIRDLTKVYSELAANIGPKIRDYSEEAARDFIKLSNIRGGLTNPKNLMSVFDEFMRKYRI